MTTPGCPPAGKHLNPDPGAAAPTAPTGDTWLRLSAALTEHLPPLAGRDDLIVVCEPGAGHGAPACLIREQGCVEVDGTYLGGEPSSIDVDDPDMRENIPVLWGLLTHEAAHAQHTCWDFGSGEPATAEAATLLEESRIEAAQIRRRPGDRRWLRAAAGKILLDEVPAGDSAWSAAAAAALILARADAGTFDPDEVTPVRDAVTKILGPATLGQLTTIWQQAHHTGDFDTDTMLELGRRWCTVLGVPPDATVAPTADPRTARTGPAGAGALRDAAGQVAATVTDHDGQDARDHADAGRRQAQRAADRNADARTRSRASAAATTVFGTPAGVPAGGGAIRRKAPPSAPATRAPTEPERSAARQLARALRAAAHREPSTVITVAPTPPGRLRARAAMTGDAQQAAGQQPTAQPWRRIQRRRHPRPPVHIGICVDVSPSMSAFAAPAASAAWITAQAATWAGGTSATITFGTYVTAITRPGQLSAQVRLFDREGNTAGFPLAVDALDAALHLADPRAGARLLVVISDGELTDAERSGGQRRLDRLTRTRCGVLWLTPPDANPLPGGQHITLNDPASAAHLIAKAATNALTAHQ